MSNDTNSPIYESVQHFNMIQKFYADPEAVNGSSEIHLTSIDLYFKNVPDAVNNTSGMRNPKVTLMICDVENDEPILKKIYSESRITHASYKNESVNLEQSFPAVYDYIDASTATIFSFKSPLKLRTGKFYGVVLIFDDPAFELWTNVSSHRLTGTNTPSTGTSHIKDGKLYLRNTSGVFRALSDTDLKIGIKVAKFVDTTSSDIYAMDPLEFFTLSNRSGSFIGGEKVFQRGANSTGTVTFTQGSTTVYGTGTLFETHYVGDPFVLHGNSTYRDASYISTITNSTVLSVSSAIPFTNTSGTKYEISPVGVVTFRSDITNQLFLKVSSANATSTFTVNSAVVGIDSRAVANIYSLDVLNVDRMQAKATISVPPGGTLTTSFATAVRSNVNTFTFDSNGFNIFRLNNTDQTDVNRYDGYVLSRSLEVLNGSLYTHVNNNILNKSLVIYANVAIDLSANGLYQSPTIGRGSIDVYATQNQVANSVYVLQSNSSSRNFNQSIDTEIATGTLAQARHIASKVTFQTGRFAEDLRVFITAYRPLTTDIKIYARVHNSQDADAFDDKSWTPLVYKTNANNYSSSIDRDDLIEYELGLPPYSDSANVFPGTITSQSGNSTLLAYGANSAVYFQPNDLIKLYNPLIPEDYVVAVVNSVAVTGSTITLGSVISNNNVVGAGFGIDRLLYPYTAFNNATNDNVARYYSTSLVEFDKFDTMQIKIVLTSNTTYVVPEIDQIQVIGVSA